MQIIKRITAHTILLFLVIHAAKAQEYTNAQLGLPDLDQVAPIANSATDALPFTGLGNTLAGNSFAYTLPYLLSIANTIASSAAPIFAARECR